MDQILFTVSNVSVTLGQLLTFVAVTLSLLLVWYIFTHRILSTYFDRKEIDGQGRSKTISILRLIFIGIFLIGFLKSFDIDFAITTIESYQVNISTVILAFIIVEAARILDWLTSKVLIHTYYTSRDEVSPRRYSPDDSEMVASKTIKYIFYTLAAMMIVSVFNLNYDLFQVPINERTLDVTISSIFIVVLIFLVARLISWGITQLLLYSYYRRSDIDAGRRFAINQLITYVIYVIAIFVTIDNIGVELTVLWGGIAALLVGVGLGLQDVFRDLVSGIILLSDRSVKVHDIVKIDDRVGEVYKIGLRTSLVLTQEETMLMVPNSQLISNKVSNWTHQNRRVRFVLTVGVAYGSDPELVRELLIKSATEHIQVLKVPKPFVRFNDFGNSALIFQLFFWSNNLMAIDDTKSELRFAINQAFTEHGIVIPFPQRDVWIKSS